MNISPNQVIATLPAIDARALLRKIKNEIINMSLIEKSAKKPKAYELVHCRTGSLENFRKRYNGKT